MEKQPHQEYRDGLAKNLQELCSEGKKEDAKITLDFEGGTREYREAKNHHIDDIKDRISEKENQVRLLTAEERLDYLLKYTKTEDLDKVSKVEVLETLKLIDECIEIGFIFGRSPDRYIDSAFYYFKLYPNMFPPISKEFYDVNSIVRYLEKINKDMNSHRKILYGILKKGAKFSKQDNVVTCDGDHDGDSQFTKPAVCECERGENEKGIGIEGRVKNFYNFIQRFKKI